MKKNKDGITGTKVAVLAAGPSNSVAGGAERFYEGLASGFRSIGCDVTIIPLVADEPSFDVIVENYRKANELDLSDFDMVVSSKAPTFAVKHSRHVMYLMHTVRVFDDMFAQAFPRPTDSHFKQRAHLHAMDIKAFASARGVFAIGHEVANRLYRWRGVSAPVIYPPLGITGFRNDGQGDYFFLPGRLHSWKRVHLVIMAVLRSALPLKLVIAGTGEAEAELRALANGDPRIVFLGRVDDAVLQDGYAKALAVPFVPQREDYGYVTLEAFASEKPVITCTDSGEPARLVRHHENGLVCEPEDLQSAMEWMFTHRDAAARMGKHGAQVIGGMSWEKVAQQLYEAGFAEVSQNTTHKKTKVTVLDMQPIDPPVGGGRLRLMGLYHALGADFECTYVGSYDWPGEKYRRHRLSATLEEIDIPLSDAHHKAAAELSHQAGGKTVIDLAFGSQGALSPAYVDAAREHMQCADVIVFSHPWVYPLVRDAVAPHQTVIYDSQNVEGFLRAQLLDESEPVQARLLRDVVEAELQLCQRASLVLACSQEDLQRFNRIYRIPGDRMRVVPNGVMAFSVRPPSVDERYRLKEQLGVQAWALVAFFIGSAYGPNAQAAHFIAHELAPAMADVLFVIGGGVGAQMRAEGANLRITGALTEGERQQWLGAADLAVNPMFSGSGTNIKMFDFMSMGLPVVTTATGARGIECGGGVEQALTIVEDTVGAFVEAIGALRSPLTRGVRGAQSRRCVEDGYAWERISPVCGQIFRNCHVYSRQTRPYFSVVIPTYERHAQLNDLMQSLAEQIERDFEVIINDQSVRPWQGRDQAWGFPLTYHHSPVKGAIRARNIGAAMAQGEVIAFTDDDCRPQPDWLLNARRHFSKNSIAGLEGIIKSDHLNDREWRPVTNVGLEGIGFMTANMMVRNECFQILGGFDAQFDHPHFREDTDFGWRLQGIGSVPYASDVCVFHPAQSRSVERESEVVRARFFEKDALLYKKHRERYRDLFFKEQHFKKNPHFAENISRGFEMHGIQMPDWMCQSLGRDGVPGKRDA